LCNIPLRPSGCLSERAFVHLNRSIVVYAAVQRNWKEAYSAGETECEKFGAVHLLAHGIWAFKVDGASGRTDLVYQEPLLDLLNVRRSGDGLVMTEWKKLSDGDGAATQFARSLRSPSGRLSRTRRVTSIRKDVTLSGRLWDLATEMLAA
jgi:hypothetical protein